LFLERFAKNSAALESCRTALEKVVSEYLAVGGPIESQDFRADNFELVPTIDSLTGTPFLRQDSHGRYLPGLVALAEVELPAAKALLRDIEAILHELRQQYRDRARRKDLRKLPDLARELGLDLDQLFRCLDFLGHETWGWANSSRIDRSAPEQSHIQPGERILQYKSLNDLFETLLIHVETAAAQRLPLGRNAEVTRNELRTSLDSYSIGNKIGEGGCASVYEARTQSDGQLVAVKIIKRDSVTTQRLRRFRNEFMFCMTARHPNVVPVLDHGVTETNEDGLPFFVMPRFPQTLRQLMSGHIPPSQILELFQQILTGVHFAHERGIVHRDLKPENLLWDSENKQILIADFGIAHFAQEDLYTLVETGLAERLANYKYAAPEQKERAASVGIQADIYALGLILNELFTRAVPQGTAFRTIGSVSQDHRFLDPVVDRMVRNAPEERPSSLRLVQEEILRGSGNQQLAQHQSMKRPRLEQPGASSLGVAQMPEVLKDDTVGPWFAEQLRIARQKMGSMNLPGSMEIRSYPVASPPNASQRSLVSAIKDSQINTFGWPIGLLLEHNDGRPRVMADGVSAEIRRTKHPSFDYWYARRDGVFYQFLSLFEDQTEFQKADRPRTLFFNTRIVRVTEALLFLARLYRSLGLEPQQAISVEIRHFGLKERGLSAIGNPVVRGLHFCMAEDVSTKIQDSLSGLETDLVRHVKMICSELFVLFDFFELDDSTYERIVTRFAAGQSV
jgi:serine/threonine protein kinase